MMQPIWRTSIRADNAAHHGFVGRYLITTHEPLPLGADPTTARAELDGWDLGAGRQVWSRVLESKGDLNVGPWNALDGKIVATVGSGYQVLDPTTGRNAVGQLPVVSSPSAGGDGMPSVIERHEQSGRLLWRTTLPKDCQFGAPGNQYFVGAYVPDVDDSVVAVSGTCDERTAAVSLVDTSRGHVLWTDRLSVSQTPDDSGVRVEQHRDFVLAVTATSVTVYDEAGKSLFTSTIARSCAGDL